MAKKENKSVIPLLAGAVGFGIFAAILAMLYLNAREKQLKAQYEQNKQRQAMVVVANADLMKGQEISEKYFSQRPVPIEFIHGDAVSPNQFSKYVGSALTANLGKGKTLLKSFIDQEYPRDFSDIIPAGKRAMTITVDDINSIGGFLRPGNRVDLFVNIPFSTSGFAPQLIVEAQEAGLLELLPDEVLDQIPEKLLAASGALEDPTSLLGSLSPSDVVIPVVQNITVLAAGRDPYQETLDRLRQPQQRSESSFSHITIEVTPEQAALITLAEDKGELVSLLRNRHDESASDFTSVDPADLFGNASKMAAAEQERAARAKTAAGVDVNGNLIDADGNKIMAREQLVAAGLTVNENGQILDKDGKVVDPKDIVIAADGTVMTKQQLAAAGLTVNESGQIVDKNGNLVNANNIVVSKDGKIMTQEQLTAAGLTVNENGEIIDASGKVIPASDIVVAEDGTVITKEQLQAAGMQKASGIDESGNLVDANGNVIANKEALASAGYTINENGEIVDKDGNTVNPDELIIASDGSVMKADEVMIAADGSVLSKEKLAAAGLTINEKGQIVDKDGNIVDSDSLVVASDGSVMSKKQLAAAGLMINEDGEVVDKNGNVIKKDDLITSANGEVLSKAELAKSGYRIDENGQIVDSKGNPVSDSEIANFAKSQSITGDTRISGEYELIIGGSSEDGVAKSQKVALPVETKTEESKK